MQVIHSILEAVLLGSWVRHVQQLLARAPECLKDARTASSSETRPSRPSKVGSLTKPLSESKSQNSQTSQSSDAGNGKLKSSPFPRLEPLARGSSNEPRVSAQISQNEEKSQIDLFEQETEIELTPAARNCHSSVVYLPSIVILPPVPISSENSSGSETSLPEPQIVDAAQ